MSSPLCNASIISKSSENMNEKDHYCKDISIEKAIIAVIDNMIKEYVANSRSKLEEVT